MQVTLDPLRVAQLDKAKPLVVREGAGGFTCALCGAEQEPHSWRVRLPEGAGPACPGCAADRGWTVR
jgi:hypothetical protein